MLGQTYKVFRVDDNQKKTYDLVIEGTTPAFGTSADTLEKLAKSAAQYLGLILNQNGQDTVTTIPAPVINARGEFPITNEELIEFYDYLIRYSHQSLVEMLGVYV